MSNIIIHNLYVNCYSVKLDIIICSMWYEIIVEYWILLEYRYDCLAWIVDHKNPLMSKMGKFIYFKIVPRGESYPRTNEIVCRSGDEFNMYFCIYVVFLNYLLIWNNGIERNLKVWRSKQTQYDRFKHSFFFLPKNSSRPMARKKTFLK